MAVPCAVLAPSFSSSASSSDSSCSRLCSAQLSSELIFMWSTIFRLPPEEARKGQVVRLLVQRFRRRQDTQALLAASAKQFSKVLSSNPACGAGLVFSNQSLSPCELHGRSRSRCIPLRNSTYCAMRQPLQLPGTRSRPEFCGTMHDHQSAERNVLKGSRHR